MTRSVRLGAFVALVTSWLTLACGQDAPAQHDTCAELASCCGQLATPMRESCFSDLSGARTAAEPTKRCEVRLDE